MVLDFFQRDPSSCASIPAYIERSDFIDNHLMIQDAFNDAFCVMLASIAPLQRIIP